MYYLVGKSLKHSKSKEIHRLISGIDYNYLELDSLENLGRDFKGINVTIPYKEKIIEYLDEIDEHAFEIGAVNTVVNNGTLKGYNTDYYGFLALLRRFDVEVEKKRVLIIGTGGTSKTVTKVLKDLLCGEITYSSRSALTTSEVKDEYDIIINTTPVGMFPDQGQILDISNFNIEVAIDLIYNPVRTRFLQSANCKAINGLYMLVAQAVKAQELFLGKRIDVTEAVYQSMLKNRNIAFIGMPMSGKSRFAKITANKLNKELLELDDIISKTDTIDNLFNRGLFRKVEFDLIDEIKFTSNKVISTGGGVILNEENMIKLSYNSEIVFIYRDLGFLQKQDKSNRPLLKEEGSLERLYFERRELYRKYADIVISTEEELYEYIDSKWS